MKSTFKNAAFLTLLFSLFAVVPARAQNSKDCTIMVVEYGGNNLAQVFVVPPTIVGTVVARDGNGLDVGESFSATATCQLGVNGTIVSADVNPLVIGATGQDTFPLGCASSPLPAGCPPANPHQGYCPPGPWSSMTNQPVVYAAGSNNTFTIFTNSEQVVSTLTGHTCQLTAAQRTTTCVASSCPLRSITVNTVAGPATAVATQVGQSVRFGATGNYSDGSTLSLSPTNQTNVPTVWTSQNTNVATITSPAPNPNVDVRAGTATGTGAGQTTITAANGSIVSASVTITVTNPPTLTSIAVTPANASILIESSQQYTATGHYNNGTSIDLTSSVVWASTNTSVSIINASGLASAKQVGITTISATFANGVTGSTSLTVGSGGGGCSCGGLCPPCGPTGDDKTSGKTQTGRVLKVQGLPCCGASPIIIDVGGHGFDLTNASGGVLFDIVGDGHPLQMAWTAQGAANAFLCLPDLNGRCDDGKDLFGNFTPQPPSNTPNGFAALAVYDDPKNGGNGDGIIDSRDAIFASLRLWIDANHDGISQPEELHTLPSLGVNSISLHYSLSGRLDQYGNYFRYRADVNPGEPTTTGRMAYDVFFVANVSGNALYAGRCSAPTVSKEALLPAKKEGMLADKK